MSDTNKKILAAVVILAVLVFVYFVTKDRDKTESEETATTTPNEISKESQDGGFDYTVDVLPQAPAAIPVPDLNRTNNFGTADNASKVRIAELSLKLKSDKNNLLAWMELGLLRKAIGDYEGARMVFEYVSKRDPKYVVPLANLGDLYQLYLKDNVLAESYMKKVIALEPDYVDGYQRLYILYNNYYPQKKAEAVNVLLNGLSTNPKNVDLMILLAEHYKSNNDKPNTIIYYDKATNELNRLGQTARMQEVKSARDSLQ